MLSGNPQAAKGSKAAQLYEKGVNLYGKAGLVRACLQIVFCAVYPWMLKCITAGQLMGLSFGSFAVLMLIFANTHSETWAQILVVAFALPMAAHFTLPVGLTVHNSDASNRGRYLGALNCFAVIPQLIDTL